MSVSLGIINVEQLPPRTFVLSVKSVMLLGEGISLRDYCGYLIEKT
jgi:hypothetical protein